MLKSTNGFNIDASPFFPDILDGQPDEVRLIYTQPLNGHQTFKLKELLKTTIEMRPLDESSPLHPLSFQLRDFVRYIFDQGWQPELIGGAAQSIVVDKELNDVDLALFFEEKPQPEYFISLVHGFFLKNFQIGHEQLKKYVRLNCVHQSMESKMLDFKFVASCDRTHLFDHDALCVPLHYTDKKKIGGFLSTVPWAQTGIDHDGFARAMSALTGKRLIISDPSSSRKAIFRVVDCMTKGFTCSKEIIDTVAGHLMTEKYNPETFQRELGFYLMGHVRSEKQQIYRSNLETFLEKLPESPETVLVREILQKLLPPNHYGNTLLTLLKEESNLKLNECLDIQTSKGVFLRSFTEHQQILETLSTNKESCLDLICRLQKGEYPRLFDCLDYCMTKGLVTLEEQVIIIQSFIHGVDPTKKQNAIAGVLDCLVKKTSFENTDLVLTLSILLKDKEATQLDPSLLLLDDVLCSLKIDQTLLHKVRCGLLKKVGISHLPAIKKLQWIQEKTIEGMRAIEILEEELANEENRSVCLKALESLDSMLVPCLAKKIFEKKLFSVLQAFPMEHVKSAIFDLSFDELLEALDSQSFTQRQFDPFLDLVNERISICLSSIDPKALKNRLNALSPSFRNTFIIDRQLFKTLHKRDARELLDLKNLDGVSTESLIWFFGFMIKDKKRLDPFEGEMLAKIIERQEDQLVCPKLFEKLGNLLLSLDEIPTETCLVLFRTFPSDEEQNYPDWIKLVLLKFYSTKSAASTPINEFRGILKSPISSRFSKEISPLSTPFFTNSLKQMLQSKDLDHKLVIPKIFRFCPIDEKEAIRTFNEILTTTTNFETINVRLEDLLSLAVEMAEVSPKVSLEYFDLLANFLYEGVKKGNTYSYERIFLTFFEGLAKSYPFLASHPTSGARIKRLVTMMTQVVFDGKNRDVLDWMAGARGKFGLEVMPQDSLVLKAATSSTRSPKSFAALMAKIHSDFILPQKSCLESLVAMGILNQRLFDDYGCDSQKAELGQEQISLLVDAYLTLILTFMTMSEKDKTIHMPLILEIFYDAMVFQHKNRLSLLSIIQDEEFDVSIGGLKSSIAQIILAYQEHAPLKCSMEHLTFLIDIIFDAMIGIKDIVAVEKEDTYEELLSNAQSLLTSLLSFEDNSVKCELLFKLKEKYCEASLALQGATISKEVRLSFKELGANLFKNFMGFSTQESNEDKKALFKQAAKEMNVSLKLFNIS